MKKIMHVNQHVIKRNRKNGTRDHVFTVKSYKDNRYANDVKILDKDGNVVAHLRYLPDTPLSCGAECWIETELDVELN